MMCDPVVGQKTDAAVQEMLDANKPFTSACISHPMIKNDPDIRHYDVSEGVRALWHGGMIGGDGSAYVRTNITVWPDGPGTPPTNAWLYHPDDYDAAEFKPRTRVLVRSGSDEDGDDVVVSLTNTADGSSVQKQCQVQKIETTLNIPRSLIKQIGWKAGDNLTVDVSGATVIVKKTADSGDSAAKKKVDGEGRIRLHGAPVEALQTTSPIALFVSPNGEDDYIQVSAVTALAATTTVPATADVTDADDTTYAPVGGKGVSVWNAPSA